MSSKRKSPPNKLEEGGSGVVVRQGSKGRAPSPHSTNNNNYAGVDAKAKKSMDDVLRKLSSRVGGDSTIGDGSGGGGQNQHQHHPQLSPGMEEENR